MKQLNRGILSSGDFLGRFYARGILSSKQFFAGDFIRGGFFLRGILSTGDFFRTQLFWMHILNLQRYSFEVHIILYIHRLNIARKFRYIYEEIFKGKRLLAYCLNSFTYAPKFKTLRAKLDDLMT